jgi:hypothetical protein
MSTAEYLVSYGTTGEFSRFRTAPTRTYQRGDRVVVRSSQGLELGVVLCPATEQHAPFLSRTAVGELLRPATEDDDRAADVLRARSQSLFSDARSLAAELCLPVEIIDAELSLDGRQAVVHYLGQEKGDLGPLESALARKHDVLVNLHNEALSLAACGKDEEVGCGRPDCGQVNGGGCSTCGSGGGCASGSCGAGTGVQAVTAYLAGLRQKVDMRRPLL